MSHTLHDIGGKRVLSLSGDAIALAAESDANDLLSAGWEHEANIVAVPVSSVADDFFVLRTRLAGDVAQKFANYGMGLAIIGDIGRWIEQSNALRDFVFEANKGKVLWFLPDIEALEEKLDG